MIACVFRELGWVEVLGSSRKNIRKYAPFYYPDYRIEIEDEEKIVFSMTYRDMDSTPKSEQIKLENEQINSTLTTTQINGNTLAIISGKGRS